MKRIIFILLVLTGISYSQLNFPVRTFWKDSSNIIVAKYSTPYRLYGNFNLPASGYFNFGTTNGTTGYGIRDDNGTLQFKNSGGDWTDFRASTLTSRFSAIDLDGSTEYMYRTYAAADSFLNMNGYERIQNANSTGFTANTGTWTNPVGSNTTITRNTTTPLFGAGDGLIIATGAGDTITNYVGLPINVTSVHGTTSGNKYTVEFWYKNAHAADGDLIILRWGDNQKSWAATSTLTKAVFNFESSSFTALEDTIKLYTSSASGDTLWIDSVNISQAYDMVLSAWIYPRSTAVAVFVGKHTAYSSLQARGFAFWGLNGTYYADWCSNFMGVGTERVIANGSIITNQWNYITIYVDRLDTLAVYVNGVYKTATATNLLGNMNTIQNFTVGANSSIMNSFVNGLIGEVRITRFDNINLSTFVSTTPLTQYNAYTLGNGFQDNITGGGKKIVVWYDWGVYDTDGNMLMDLSGNGYNLTGTNTTTADHVFWKR